MITSVTPAPNSDSDPWTPAPMPPRAGSYTPRLPPAGQARDETNCRQWFERSTDTPVLCFDARSISPRGGMTRRLRTAHRAVCLGVSCIVFLGLVAFPGGAGRDPHHVHLVVGGTPAERARALALHLVRERAGVDGGTPPPATPAAERTGSAGARVFSLRGNGGGPAVLSVGRSGAVLNAAAHLMPVPSQASRAAAYSPSRVPHIVPSTPDPPPRRVAA